MPDLLELWESDGPLLGALAALAGGFVVVGLIYRVLARVGRRVPVVARVASATHKPVQLLVAVLVAAAVVLASTASGEGAPGWRAPLLHGLLVAAIATGGWLLGALLLLVEDAAMSHLWAEETEEIEARKVHTQAIILRRLTVAMVTVLTIGAVLYTFDSVRGIGASLLASAGLLGVVAGLAAQSMLGNLFAGLQLAFGNRLRVDDVVVVEGEWGHVEELTLGYVVVRIWDQRRLMLPTSYFTSNPFVSWTRNSNEILATVELDVDWNVPVPEVREELERFVRSHPKWDGRMVSMVVLDATGGNIRLRPLVSAQDANEVWGLQCAVREHLVEWIRTTYPDALPRVRAEVAGAGSAGADGASPLPAQHRSGGG